MVELGDFWNLCPQTLGCERSAWPGVCESGVSDGGKKGGVQSLGRSQRVCVREGGWEEMLNSLCQGCSSCLTLCACYPFLLEWPCRTSSPATLAPSHHRLSCHPRTATIQLNAPPPPVSPYPVCTFSFLNINHHLKLGSRGQQCPECCLTPPGCAVSISSANEDAEVGWPSGG